MTTFDDSDLFDHVEEDDGARDHRNGRRVGVVLAVAAALVVAGVAWLLLSRAAGTSSADDMTVGLLEREQQPTDDLDDVVAQETGVDPATTRFAVRTAAGQHFAALRWDGALCLVVVPDGDQARTSCAGPRPGAVATLTAEDGSSVRLGADDAPAPATEDDWQPAGANVWVLPAPPAEG